MGMVVVDRKAGGASATCSWTLPSSYFLPLMSRDVRVDLCFERRVSRRVICGRGDRYPLAAVVTSGAVSASEEASLSLFVGRTKNEKKICGEAATRVDRNEGGRGEGGVLLGSLALSVLSVVRLICHHPASG